MALLLCVLPFAATAGALEDEVLLKLNQVRADPAAYARELRQEVAAGKGDPVQADGDEDAFADAVAFLAAQKPLPPLSRDERLAASARAHVIAQGARGDVGHGAFGQRLISSGVRAAQAAENISYGEPTAREVVRQLVVDVGVPDRGHRKTIVAADYQVAGVACGPHVQYGAMCVIDFAGDLFSR